MKAADSAKLGSKVGGRSDGILSFITNMIIANLDGTVMTFNFSTPIKKDTNTSAILVEDILTKPGGDGQKPFFVDGAMLYNDAEAFLFGGAMFSFPEAYDPPDSDDVVLYQAYNVGPDKPLWKRGFYTRKTGDDVNRYVAYGGAASAPSEDKAWYFSGLTAPRNGQIDTIAWDNRTNFAQKVSNRLITVDMGTQNDEQWSNTTIGRDVEGRANPEMVWVPVGREGILVVLGGVTYPQWAGTEKSQQSDDPEASVSVDPFISLLRSLLTPCVEKRKRRIHEGHRHL
jgi:hypothetical protein